MHIIENRKAFSFKKAFDVGAEGFETPTLPAHKQGCSEPAISFSIRVLLFQASKSFYQRFRSMTI
jgi:hypothetical protein